jgi:hypothetical protein
MANITSSSSPTAKRGDGQDPTGAVKAILERSPVVLHTIGFCIGTKHSLNQPDARSTRLRMIRTSCGSTCRTCWPKRRRSPSPGSSKSVSCFYPIAPFRALAKRAKLDTPAHHFNRPRFATARFRGISQNQKTRNAAIG